MNNVLLLIVLINLFFSNLYSKQDLFSLYEIPLPEALEKIMERNHRPEISPDGMHCLPRNPREIIYNTQEDFLFITFFPDDPTWLEELQFDKDFKSNYLELKEAAQHNNFHVNATNRYWLYVRFESREQLYDFMIQYAEDPGNDAWIHETPLGFLIRIGYISLTRNNRLYDNHQD